MTYRLYTPSASPNDAFNRTWIVNAPWAHPAWSDYVVMLYDLTTAIPDLPAPVLYKAGVTHEFMVLALDPSKPVDPPSHMLQPANHGYQFKADSDADAEARIVQMLDLIAAGKLSPDTDLRQMWDSLMLDGVSLHMREGGIVPPKGGDA